MTEHVHKRPDNRGEQSGRAILTEDDVRAIRELYSIGEYSQRDLSFIFNVSRPAIGCVIRRETWTHVQ